MLDVVGLDPVQRCVRQRNLLQGEDPGEVEEAVLVQEALLHLGDLGAELEGVVDGGQIGVHGRSSRRSRRRAVSTR